MILKIVFILLKCAIFCQVVPRAAAKARLPAAGTIGDQLLEFVSVWPGKGWPYKAEAGLSVVARLRFTRLPSGHPDLTD